MFLSELRIENFRMFGEGNDALLIPFNAGLTALVGENDSGKTAVIDALRLVLGTRDQEFFRIDDGDFHQPGGDSKRRTKIAIRCKFSGLTSADHGAFAEYLTYEDVGGSKKAVLYVNWIASSAAKGRAQRQYTSVEVRSGLKGDGPHLDGEARLLLCATYLRPLRDAGRAMSGGRASRLSQILQYTKEVKDGGESFDPSKTPTDPATLGVLGIGDYANYLLQKSKGIETARDRLNKDYLQNLSFSGDVLQGAISVSGAKGDDSQRLRQLLEKLELELRNEGDSEPPPSRGLGSNNLLFMACELLLLGEEEDGFPLLLIEEPEAHLHPQRQLRLMRFLQERSNEKRADSQQIQVIITTHSPNLASVIDLNNLVLMHGKKAFPLGPDHTELSKSDYGFLERFLDVTKANLFFARGVVVVEGDAENILLPTLAKILGRDFSQNGVSIVNVGSTGLGRYARIYLRKSADKGGWIAIPIACIADLDVMPDCAAEIVGRVKPGEAKKDKGQRRWLEKSDFTGEQLEQHRAAIKGKASSQNVETFVADEWTLEYDLAFAGLGEELWVAICLALNDHKINAGSATTEAVCREAKESYSTLLGKGFTKEQLASHIYEPLATQRASKAIAAQYLACLLEAQWEKKQLTSQVLEAKLPRYVKRAIEHVARYEKLSEGAVAKTTLAAVTPAAATAPGTPHG